MPGLAKTLTVATLAQAMQGNFKRIQFTPDLVPADLTGTRIFNQKNGEFVTMLGPVFANLVLADEINRAPAKVQSALLEVMQERQVTIAGETSYVVPRPFVVMATQNPIETEGTYALPEAQVDRFMMKVLIGYPIRGRRIRHRPARHRRAGSRWRTGHLHRCSCWKCRWRRGKLYVDPSLMIYAVKVVAATRAPEKCGLPQFARFIQYGASPRASIAMIEAGRALAFIRGRDYVLPADVMDVAADVLRHRLVPSYEALSEGMSSDDILKPHPARRPTAHIGDVACRQSSDIRPAPPGIAGDAPAGRVVAGRSPQPVARRGAWIWRICANTSSMTMCGAWTGTPPPAWMRPIVRDYLEDREIPVWFLLDMSPSMMLAGVSVTKHARC